MFFTFISHVAYGIHNFINKYVSPSDVVIMIGVMVISFEDKYLEWKRRNDYYDLFAMFKNASIEDIHNRIIEKNIDINTSVGNEYGYRYGYRETYALNYAALYNRIDLIEYLLDIGAILPKKIGCNAFYEALLHSNYDIAIYMHKRCYETTTEEEIKYILVCCSKYYEHSYKAFKYFINVAVKNNLHLTGEIYEENETKYSILSKLSGYDKLRKSFKLYLKHVVNISQNNLNVSLNVAVIHEYNIKNVMQLIQMGAKLEHPELIDEEPMKSIINMQNITVDDDDLDYQIY